MEGYEQRTLRLREVRATLRLQWLALTEYMLVRSETFPTARDMDSVYGALKQPIPTVL